MQNKDEEGISELAQNMPSIWESWHPVEFLAEKRAQPPNYYTVTNENRRKHAEKSRSQITHTREN